MPERQEVLREAFARHLIVTEKSLDEIFPNIQKGAEMLLEALKTNKRMFTCGNGGSAMDAMHFAGSEWLGRYHDDRLPLPAISLVADVGALTTISNDYGYEYIFSRQIEALGNSGDILVAFSTSGKSSNILRAIESAKKKGMKIIAMTGAKGAALKDTTDLAIVVPSEETARIQEVHELIYHTWCEYIDSKIIKG